MSRGRGPARRNKKDTQGAGYGHGTGTRESRHALGCSGEWQGLPPSCSAHAATSARTRGRKTKRAPRRCAVDTAGSRPMLQGHILPRPAPRIAPARPNQLPGRPTGRQQAFAPRLAGGCVRGACAGRATHMVAARDGPQPCSVGTSGPGAGPPAGGLPVLPHARTRTPPAQAVLAAGARGQRGAPPRAPRCACGGRLRRVPAAGGAQQAARAASGARPALLGRPHMRSGPRAGRLARVRWAGPRGAARAAGGARSGRASKRARRHGFQPAPGARPAAPPTRGPCSRPPSRCAVSRLSRAFLLALLGSEAFTSCAQPEMSIFYR
jgi:hypothetical protein